jgi:DNA-binding Xre family transcriptional regulator
MKMTSQGKQLFLSDVRTRMAARRWNCTNLATKSGVHQSQVSRIVAGKFKTFGSAVIKICINLDLEPSDYWAGAKADKNRWAIADSAIAIWDGSRRDALVVISLLKEIAKLRRGGGRT